MAGRSRSTPRFIRPHRPATLLILLWTTLVLLMGYRGSSTFVVVVGLAGYAVLAVAWWATRARESDPGQAWPNIALTVVIILVVVAAVAFAAISLESG